MTIFELSNDTIPTAQALANGFLAEANQAFDDQRVATYDTIQRFWYRNRDAVGNPSLEGEQPTGIEILLAMGTSAKAAIDVAHARVAMLFEIEQRLGLANLVDLEKCQSPYNLEFYPDGSLKSATPKN